MRSAILAVLAACSSPAAPPIVANRPAPPAAPAPYRATLRIDPEPIGAKHFQGVWLELPSGARWLIDDRPRELWKGFADREVVVRGHCYTPYGEALLATHFAIASLDFAGPVPADVPYRHVGGERRIRGAFEMFTYPSGSKLGGEREVRFVADDHTSYRFGVGGALLRTHGRFTLTARDVEPNPTYAAQPDVPMLWISAVDDADDQPDPSTAPVEKPCP